MAAAELTSTCTVCGTEESLESIILRMTDDADTRRLIVTILERSQVLGGLVIRYLRLHKPAKQKLRLDKVAKLLTELLDDMNRGCIVRKGREWPIDTEGWKLALAAVFAAQGKGTLTLPLEGNAYLYEVVMRLSDKAEGAAEKQAETTSRGRSYQGGSVSIGDVIGQAIPAMPATPTVTQTQPAIPPAPVQRPRVESPLVKAMKAQVRADAPKGMTTPSTPSINPQE